MQYCICVVVFTYGFVFDDNRVVRRETFANVNFEPMRCTKKNRFAKVAL